MNTTMPVLGITGKARVGKDTFADVLVANHGYVKLSFADPLRQMVSVFTGLSLEQLSDGAVKEEVIELFGKSPRQIMQILGTDACRQMIRQDIWLRLLEQKVQQHMQENTAKGIVIADVRFDDEAHFIKNQLNGTVIQITRPNCIQVNQHVSEMGLQTFKVALTLVNDSTLLEYQYYADQFGDDIATGKYPAQNTVQAA